MIAAEGVEHQAAQAEERITGTDEDETIRRGGGILLLILGIIRIIPPDQNAAIGTEERSLVWLPPAGRTAKRWGSARDDRMSWAASRLG